MVDRIRRPGSSMMIFWASASDIFSVTLDFFSFFGLMMTSLPWFIHT
jgi:hypothetical protein